jgi:archaellum component FlaC
MNETFEYKGFSLYSKNNQERKSGKRRTILANHNGYVGGGLVADDGFGYGSLVDPRDIISKAAGNGWKSSGMAMVNAGNDKKKISEGGSINSISRHAASQMLQGGRGAGAELRQGAKGDEGVGWQGEQVDTLEDFVRHRQAGGVGGRGVGGGEKGVVRRWSDIEEKEKAVDQLRREQEQVARELQLLRLKEAERERERRAQERDSKRIVSIAPHQNARGRGHAEGGMDVDQQGRIHPPWHTSTKRGMDVDQKGQIHQIQPPWHTSTGEFSNAQGVGAKDARSMAVGVGRKIGVGIEEQKSKKLSETPFSLAHDEDVALRTEKGMGGWEKKHSSKKFSDKPFSFSGPDIAEYQKGPYGGVSGEGLAIDRRAEGRRKDEEIDSLKALMKRKDQEIDSLKAFRELQEQNQSFIQVMCVRVCVCGVFVCVYESA